MPQAIEAVLRLAIYARVSTEEQREGQNIDSQIAELERFSREKGFPIAGIYKDDGWSGGVMERPELDRLRDDAQKGIFDAVLINDVDRLARDVAHLGVVKRDLERKGMKVIFRKLPSDTSPTSNLMVNILGSFAEFERELISDRTRRGRRHKVEVRKQYLGSNTAYGYRYLPIDRLAGREGILEVAPEEARVVQRMFEWVDQEGLSARKVLNRLNDLNIRPKNGAALWAKSSVLRILHCETYAGTWHYNKFQGCEPRNPVAKGSYRKRAKCSVRQRPRTEWLPLELPESLCIVPRDRWQRVQRQLAINLTFSPRNEKHVYLLKSLVKCGGCGSRYVGDPCHGRFYYRCIARCKKQPSISEHILNQAVKTAVTRVLVNPAVIVEPLRELNRAREAEDRNKTARKTSIERDRENIVIEEQRILEAYRVGVITPTQLGEQLERLKSRRSTLDLEEGEHEPRSDVRSEEMESAVSDYCAEAARNLADFTTTRWQEFLRTVIETAVFHGDHIVIRGRIPAGEDGSGAAIKLDEAISPQVGAAPAR